MTDEDDEYAVARIPCKESTRDEILRPLKRNGETYDQLLRNMAEQYQPMRARRKNMPVAER